MSTDNGIHGTGSNAQSAAYTGGFVHYRDMTGLISAVGRVDRRCVPSQQARDSGDCGITARRTAIDVSSAGQNGFGIGPATRIAALRALRRRQQCFQLIQRRLVILRQCPVDQCEAEPDNQCYASENKNCCDQFSF